MYGTYFVAGTDNNVDVADTYKMLFKRNAKTSPGGPPKLDAQVMAVALASYLTKESFVSMRFDPMDPDNSVIDPTLVAGVESYGFEVTVGGVGSTYFDVGDNYAAFGVDADNSTQQIIDLLLMTDSMSTDGLLYDYDHDGDATDSGGDGTIDEWEELLRTLANEVYSAINEAGHI
jgi:hypothetical protein